MGGGRPAGGSAATAAQPQSIGAAAPPARLYVIGASTASRTAKPVHPHQVSQAFKQRAKEAGLPRICLRDLRHTHATLALQAGIHPKVAACVRPRLRRDRPRVPPAGRPACPPAPVQPGVRAAYEGGGAPSAPAARPAAHLCDSRSSGASTRKSSRSGWGTRASRSRSTSTRTRCRACRRSRPHGSGADPGRVIGRAGEPFHSLLRPKKGGGCERRRLSRPPSLASLPGVSWFV